jgi:hypothetical protein
MALQLRESFDGATTLKDGRDTVQSIAGNATRFSEFLPAMQGPKRNIAERLLRLFYLMGLCCAIVEEFAMYVGGLLESDPDLITIYMAYHPEMLSPEIPILLQIQPTSVFTLDNFDFWFMPSYSRPGDNVFYTVRYGVELVAFRIACINSLQPYGPRSNLDLTHFLWANFSYYCTNYAVVMLPSQTLGSRILYTLHFKAEIGGEDSRACKRCFWDIENPRWRYDFSCQKPNSCTYTLCCKQPLSLKTAAAKIVFGLFNLNKFCFEENTTYNEYVYAVRADVNIPLQQLVPFTEFPSTLTISCVQFDNLPHKQFHEHCSLAVNMQGSGKWSSTLQRRFETRSEFVHAVLHCKTKCWCAYCGKSLFVLPRRKPCQGYFH